MNEDMIIFTKSVQTLPTPNNVKIEFPVEGISNRKLMMKNTIAAIKYLSILNPLSIYFR